MCAVTAPTDTSGRNGDSSGRPIKQSSGANPSSRQNSKSPSRKLVRARSRDESRGRTPTQLQQLQAAQGVGQQPKSPSSSESSNNLRSARLRIVLCLLAGGCWSLYTILNSIHQQHGSNFALLQEELAAESHHLATLFGMTVLEQKQQAALDAKALLENKVALTASTENEKQRTDTLYGQQQQREMLQSSQLGIPTSISNIVPHSSGLDFSHLDASHHHAIVIPYRDRKFHLEQFIEHMGPYLRRNFANETFELWLVEQDDSFLFNRAWLANVGIANIQEQNRRYRFQQLQQKQKLSQQDSNHQEATVITVPPPPTCIILHDVDLIPTVDGVPYTNCSRPMQLGSELAHFNGSIPYPIYTGGVGPTMSLGHWVKINGMSNDFYGWGGEDDELWHRLRLTGLLKKPVRRPTMPPDKDGKPVKGPKFWPPEIERPPKGRGKFRPISEAQTVHHNEKGHNQWTRIGYMLELMQNNSARWKKDGLSDLRMTITGDAMTVTHLDSIEIKNATTAADTDPTVLATTRATTTTFTRKHYVTAKQKGSVISSLSIDPFALASFVAIHHISAIPKITPLEFIHVTQTDGGRIERAGARAGIPWGACHYHHALEKEMLCPDIADPEWEGKIKLRKGLETHSPWHSPLQDFEENPYKGRPTFAVVRNPYDRLIDYYYCPWNGYKGEEPNNPKNLNKFIQARLFPPKPKENPEDKEKKDEEKKKIPPPPAFFHLRPEFHYLFANNAIADHSQPFVTHILRYENLEEDFAGLMKLYGLDQRVKLPVPLPKPDQEYRMLTPDDFTDSSLRMIAKFYNNDFVRFGYSMRPTGPRKTLAPHPPSANQVLKSGPRDKQQLLEAIGALPPN